MKFFISKLIILAMLANVSACFDEEEIPKRSREHHEHHQHANGHEHRHEGASCDDPSHNHHDHEHNGHTHAHHHEHMTWGVILAASVAAVLLIKFCGR